MFMAPVENKWGQMLGRTGADVSFGIKRLWMVPLGLGKGEQVTGGGGKEQGAFLVEHIAPPISHLAKVKAS